MQTQPEILVVDDDPSARGFFERLLSVSGYQVTTAASAVEAKTLVEKKRFDTVLSDISMPGMSGIELLQAIRGHDLDVPVLLVTGNPNVDSAAKAVQFGALRYLMKPVAAEQLLESVGYAVQVDRLAQVKRKLLAGLGHSGGSDLAGLAVGFERAVQTLWMAFQPIVSHTNKNIFAYEALCRSADETLPHIGAILDAGERLDRLPELGRTIRRRVAERIASCGREATFFVNLHPRDLADDELFNIDSPLTRFAKNVVLEVTERAHLDDMPDVAERIQKLRTLGYRIALDDLGAGYAGLNSFIRLKPDIVKIDMELVRGIDTDNTRQELVRSLFQLCRSLNISVVAEGIENHSERRTLAGLGLDLLQGYAFAKPNRELVDVANECFI